MSDEAVVARNPHGPEFAADGSVRFRLWAPALERVELELAGERALLPMQAVGEGWYEARSDRARPGTRYRFVLPDGMRVPDPASRYQPDGPHGFSELVDPRRWSWSDSAWQGRRWDECVVYELHIGTFTPEGTFRAVIDKLDHLVDLGVTAIQLMPIASFPGRRNWGYDGVMLYAPVAVYGRPEDLKALVEAAHARSIAVLLDVVYNHFGPEGNYLWTYAPAFFTERHHTPWGAAVNYDSAGCEAVREFVIQNALYWVRQFHLDGLRLDAVHAIIDDSPKHILAELAERVRAESTDRRVHLILENEGNEARWLERDASLRPKFYTAQWNDDVHHVLHTAVTGEYGGYYVDYRGDTEKLGRALAEGFAFQGETMVCNGRARGEASVHLPPAAFIGFLQNHDQIGNRAFGDRIRGGSARVVRAAAAVYLLLPQIPMLFMGEEWGTSRPFPFFCDFGPELAAAVIQGRRDEFAAFPEFRDPHQRERIPDPQSEATFQSAKLDWDALAAPAHAASHEWYRRILAVRRRYLPLLASIRRGGAYRVLGRGAVAVEWQANDVRLLLATNLSDVAIDLDGWRIQAPDSIWIEGEITNDGGTLAPWTVAWWMSGERRQARS